MYEIFASHEQANLYATLENKENGVEPWSWEYDPVLKHVK